MAMNKRFTHELDLHLHYSPPMPESGSGIVVTRELHLPFVPHERLLIFSKAIDDCPDPMGFCIKDVVWDIDREVVLAIGMAPTVL